MLGLRQNLFPHSWELWESEACSFYQVCHCKISLHLDQSPISFYNFVINRCTYRSSNW